MKKSRKNPAAVALGKKRWSKVTSDERTEYAHRIVNIREETRARRRADMEAVIRDAHIPSYLKIKLLNLHAGKRHEDRSYLDVGYHLGRYHIEDFCEDMDRVSEADEREVLAHPSRVLRRIFSGEEHPRGELTDLIPAHRRREFLIGLLAGACENGPGEGWLSLLEE